MEEDVKIIKNYTHKIMDYSNGGICIFYGSEKECNEFLKLKSNKNKNLKLLTIYNEI